MHLLKIKNPRLKAGKLKSRIDAGTASAESYICVQIAHKTFVHEQHYTISKTEASTTSCSLKQAPTFRHRKCSIPSPLPRGEIAVCLTFTRRTKSSHGGIVATDCLIVNDP